MCGGGSFLCVWGRWSQSPASHRRTPVWFWGIYSPGEKTINGGRPGKRPGINDELHLNLGILLFLGRNEKLSVPMLGIPVEKS